MLIQKLIKIKAKQQKIRLEIVLLYQSQLHKLMLALMNSRMGCYKVRQIIMLSIQTQMMMAEFFRMITLQVFSVNLYLSIREVIRISLVQLFQCVQILILIVKTIKNLDLNLIGVLPVRHFWVPNLPVSERLFTILRSSPEASSRIQGVRGRVKTIQPEILKFQ